MPKNVGDLGKFIVAKGFKKLPKSKNRPIWSHCVTQEGSIFGSPEKVSKNGIKEERLSASLRFGLPFSN